MANTTAQGEASTSSNEVIESNHVSSSQQKPPRHFKFPAHHDHMLSLAKMCKENKQFADCIIQSDNGLKHHAHRLVLGASSSFLTMIFQQVPPSLPEATILVPGVKDTIVKALLDFLYTGEMSVEREDTADLQLLIETLQINPNLISVDMVEDSNDDVARSGDTDEANIPKHEMKTNCETKHKEKSCGVKRSNDQESDQEENNCKSFKKAKCSTEKSYNC